MSAFHIRRVAWAILLIGPAIALGACVEGKTPDCTDIHAMCDPGYVAAPVSDGSTADTGSSDASSATDARDGSSDASASDAGAG
jgi:hypothetical protein